MEFSKTELHMALCKFLKPSVKSILKSLVHAGPKSHKFGKSNRPKWYQKPIMKSAIYTDLQRGAWHIAFYTLVRKIF